MKKLLVLVPLFAFVVSGCLSSISSARYAAMEDQVRETSERAARAERERDAERERVRRLAVDGPSAVPDASASTDAAVTAAPVPPTPPVGVAMGGPVGMGMPASILPPGGLPLALNRHSLPYAMAVRIGESWVSMGYPSGAPVTTSSVIRVAGLGMPASHVSLPVAAPGSVVVFVFRNAGGGTMRIYLFQRVASGAYVPVMYRDRDYNDLEREIQVVGDTAWGFRPCSWDPSACLI
jgi:phosphate/sulfate permease